MNTKKVISLALGIASIMGLTVFADPAKTPNLLVIITDEHNFRTLGVYRELLPRDQALMWGDAVVETPHIDRIGKEGVVCTSFYATTLISTSLPQLLLCDKIQSNENSFCETRR